MNYPPSATQDLLALSSSLGLQLPTLAYIVGALLFSTIGLVAWHYGRKLQRSRMKWLGVALMFYGYVAVETWILYAVGMGLSLALYVWRRV